MVHWLRFPTHVTLRSVRSPVVTHHGLRYLYAGLHIFPVYGLIHRYVQFTVWFPFTVYRLNVWLLRTTYLCHTHTHTHTHTFVITLPTHYPTRSRLFPTIHLPVTHHTWFGSTPFYCTFTVWLVPTFVLHHGRSLHTHTLPRTHYRVIWTF